MVTDRDFWTSIRVDLLFINHFTFYLIVWFPQRRWYLLRHFSVLSHIHALVFLFHFFLFVDALLDDLRHRVMYLLSCQVTINLVQIEFNLSPSLRFIPCEWSFRFVHVVIQSLHVFSFFNTWENFLNFVFFLSAFSLFFDVFFVKVHIKIIIEQINSILG